MDIGAVSGMNSCHFVPSFHWLQYRIIATIASSPQGSSLCCPRLFSLPISLATIHLLLSSRECSVVESYNTLCLEMSIFPFSIMAFSLFKLLDIPVVSYLYCCVVLHDMNILGLVFINLSVIIFLVQ